MPSEWGEFQQSKCPPKVKLRAAYFQNSLTPIALLSMFYCLIFALYTEWVFEGWVSPKK
jgi:hypothetical protein